MKRASHRGLHAAMVTVVLLAPSSCTYPDPGSEATLGAKLTRTPAATDAGSQHAGAERVLRGVVRHTVARYSESAHGDRLIFTAVTLDVEEIFRGPSTATQRFVLEGGTVGDVSLEVSDLPRLRVGDRGRFALSRDERGTWHPHDRGKGIVLDRQSKGRERHP